MNLMSFMCNERNIFVILQQHLKYTLSRIKWREIIKREICLSFSLLYLFICSWKFFIIETRAYDIVTDSCRGCWNVRNYSSSHVQVFRDRRSVQIDDGWNVRNWSIHCTNETTSTTIFSIDSKNVLTLKTTYTTSLS